MTNEMARSILSLAPYIAGVCRNVARKSGVTLCDLDVDDLVSTVTEKALTSVQLDADRNVKGWLATAARTSTVDFLRSGHVSATYFGSKVNLTDARNSESTDDDSVSVGLTMTDTGIDAERAMVAAELMSDIRLAIGDLPTSMQALASAMLDAGEDFDSEAFAATHGIKPATVRVQMNRARAALREMF